jgi:hypothetical protein
LPREFRDVNGHADPPFDERRPEEPGPDGSVVPLVSSTYINKWRLPGGLPSEPALRVKAGGVLQGAARFLAGSFVRRSPV